MGIKTVPAEKIYQRARAVLLSSVHAGGRELGEVFVQAIHIGMLQLEDVPEDYEVFELHFVGEPHLELEWVLVEGSEDPLTLGFLSLVPGPPEEGAQRERFALLVGRAADLYLRNKSRPEWAPPDPESVDEQPVGAFVGTRIGPDSRQSTLWWRARTRL